MATGIELVTKTEPWQHQRDAIEFALHRPASMLSLTMGAGKSLVVTSIVGTRHHRQTLILCPASVIGVWPREFERHCGAPVDVLPFKKGNGREKALAAHQFLQRKDGRLKVVVVNYETAWREPFGSFARSTRWDLVALDESHRVKNPHGKIGKFVDKLRPWTEQRLCLTGTPMPHSPLDIYSQFRFLDPTIFGKSYTAFRGRYAIINEIFPSQVRRWINQEELSELIAENSFTVGREVLDLPEAVHSQRTIELCPKARRIYDSLENELIAEVDQGVISVPNALVKLLRLQQISSGWIEDDDGHKVRVDTGKEEALTDLLEDLPTAEPVVVMCRFRADLATVQAVASKLGRRYGEISGSRKDLTPQATMPDNVDLMGVQIASGGVGIDLVRARYCVYLSLGYSLGEYEQSVARVHRPGQTRAVNYYHLVAEKTVDEAVYAAIEKRKDIVETVLGAYKKGTKNVGR